MKRTKQIDFTSQSENSWKDILVLNVGLLVVAPLAIGIGLVVWADLLPRDTHWGSWRANDVLGMISLGFFLSTLFGLFKLVVALMDKLSSKLNIPVGKIKYKPRNGVKGLIYGTLEENSRKAIRTCMQPVWEKFPDCDTIYTGLRLAASKQGKTYVIVLPLSGYRLDQAKQLLQGELKKISRPHIRFELFGITELTNLDYLAKEGERMTRFVQ